MASRHAEAVPLGKWTKSRAAAAQARKITRRARRGRARQLARVHERQFGVGSCSFGRIIGCARSVVKRGGQVGIAVKASLSVVSAYEVGVMFCGQLWTCACCSSVIRSERAAMLKAECERYAADGGQFVMLTLTMRHAWGDSLKDERQAMSKAWASLRCSAAFRRLGREVDGFVSATEVTTGENGWHLHKHVLFWIPLRRRQECVASPVGFARRPEVEDYPTGCLSPSESLPAACSRLVEVCALIKPLRGVWCRLIRLHTGREPVADRAFDVQVMDSGAGVYLSKIGDELVRADSKDRSPFALLDDGDEESLDRFVEYADAMKGCHALEYSKGLRELLGSLPEVSDQELVGQERGGVVVEWFDSATWRAMVDHVDSWGVSEADRRLTYWEDRARRGLVDGVDPGG